MIRRVGCQASGVRKASLPWREGFEGGGCSETLCPLPYAGFPLQPQVFKVISYLSDKKRAHSEARCRFHQNDPKEDILPDRPKTPTYFIFFILFHPDTWRILFGFCVSILLTPQLAPPDLATPGRLMLYVMIATIGWAVSGKPAGWITTGLKKWLLRDAIKK